MSDLNELKASVRSILLSCGKTATEQEFRKTYYEIEGESFNTVLNKYNIRFQEFFLKIPDVARVIYVQNTLLLQRVSNEASSHMDNLTINKYTKNYRGQKLVTKSGAIRGRPTTNPVNPQALPYNNAMRTQNYATNMYNPQQNSNFYAHPNYNRNFTYVPPQHVPNMYQMTHTMQNPQLPYYQTITPNNYPARTINNVQTTNNVHLKITLPITPSRSTKVEPTASSSIKKPPSNLCTPNRDNNETKNPEKPRQNLSDIFSRLTLQESKQKAAMLMDKIKPKMSRDQSQIDNDVDKENLSSPKSIKNQLRSLKIFRNAIKQAISNDVDKTSKKPATDIRHDGIMTLPKPSKNSRETVFEIKIIDVMTPSNFTFQFAFKKSKELSRELNSFYGDIQNLESYRIELVKDDIVAVRQDTFWYRGKIASFRNTIAEVHNVDALQDSPQIVSSKNIFALHQKFSIESPKSAVGRLHGLKPIKKEWNLLSASKILDYQNKIVLASVMAAVEDDVYSMCIYANSEKFSRLNDELLAEKLAQINNKDFESRHILCSLE